MNREEGNEAKDDERSTSLIIIRITDIPSRGLEVADHLDCEALNARMNEAPENDIRFLTAPTFALRIKPEIAGAELRGSIEASYEQPCGRCLQLIERTIRQDLLITLKAKSHRPGIDRATSSSEWDDDIGIVYFDGEQIDLEEILQESLILSINPFESEHPKCPGPPTHRGHTSDDSSERKPTLGDLLKDLKVGTDS